MCNKPTSHIWPLLCPRCGTQCIDTDGRTIVGRFVRIFLAEDKPRQMCIACWLKDRTHTDYIVQIHYFDPVTIKTL